jgi:hypothetical protein
MQKFKCPFCSKVYIKKVPLYEHMELEHLDLLKSGDKELPAAQIYFNVKNKYAIYKGNGNCIICKALTDWNVKAEKYNRLCTNEKCKEQYREDFKTKMLKTYGKTHLLDSPDQQKMMLSNRKISGKYTFQNGKEFEYVGKLELGFLKFLDIVMEWPTEDIISPAPQIFKYEKDGKEHFHFPDFYIPSLELIIQIKSSENKHYRLRDIDSEKIIDNLIEKSKYNYIKIYDKNNGEFIKFLIQYRNLKLKTR